MQWHKCDSTMVILHCTDLSQILTTLLVLSQTELYNNIF